MITWFGTLHNVDRLIGLADKFPPDKFHFGQVPPGGKVV